MDRGSGVLTALPTVGVPFIPEIVENSYENCVGKGVDLLKKRLYIWSWNICGNVPRSGDDGDLLTNQHG